MSRFVVDASVAIKWFLTEIHSEAAIRLLHSSHRLLAPDLLYAEVGNVLWKNVRREELSSRDADRVLQILLKMPIGIHSTASLIEPAFEIAIALDRSVYDSLYLSLAVIQDCPLVTADRKLHRVVAGGTLGKHVIWVDDIPEM